MQQRVIIVLFIVRDHVRNPRALTKLQFSSRDAVDHYVTLESPLVHQN